MANDVRQFVDNKIKNINRDITFKAQIVEKVSDTKYKILYKKQYHTAWCLADLTIGSTVHVCAPGNDWSELFINQSCTRKEFEQLNTKIDKVKWGSKNIVQIKFDVSPSIKSVYIDFYDTTTTYFRIQFNGLIGAITYYRYTPTDGFVTLFSK